MIKEYRIVNRKRGYCIQERTENFIGIKIWRDTKQWTKKAILLASIGDDSIVLNGGVIIIYKDLLSAQYALKRFERGFAE